MLKCFRHYSVVTSKAIECGLSGVKDTFPASGEFDELVDYIITLTKDPMHIDVCIQLFSKLCSCELIFF